MPADITLHLPVIFCMPSGSSEITDEAMALSERRHHSYHTGLRAASFGQYEVSVVGDQARFEQ
jgi:hypothetical protein